MNLCVNARDAMPQGGTLKISSRRISKPDAYLLSRRGDYTHPVYPGRHRRHRNRH